MGGAKDLALTFKRNAGRHYRAAQRDVERLVFERGLHSTVQHEASSGHLFLRRALRGCRIEPGDCFLDYGSGRGRVLLHAARLPFARVIGLDLDEDGCAVARANAALFASRSRCGQIEVVNADATLWEVPDEVAYVYMFNPFWDEVFDGAIARVIDSLDRRPRPLKVLYAYPRCAERLLDTGRFELVRTSRGLRPDMPQHRIDVFQARVTG